MAKQEVKQPSEYLQDFLNFLTSAEQNLKSAIECEKECNKLTQDILHQLELGDDPYKSRAKIATKLRKCRQERRIHKDTIELLDPIVQWAADNKQAVNKLKECLGAVRKQEKYHKYRVYVKKSEENQNER